MTISKFNELPVSGEVLRAVETMGFEEATPIQAQSIPHILEGRDILGQAQTGTGKTCAFGIPIIDRIDTEDRHVQYLILSPTRELAMQIADELRQVCMFKEGVRIASVYGGQPIHQQILALKKKPQIIVGTPGRVMDHMRRKTIRLANLRGIILDEADEMLNMGFVEDINTILTETPPMIQKIFFSATMPKAILELTEKYLSEPVHVRIASKELTVQKIEQHYIELKGSSKLEVLTRLIEKDQVQLALVFCNTKRRTDELTSSLQSRGYAAQALHGDMNQRERTRVMDQFKKKDVRILVATDVAARGIDVNNIELVINFDVPQDEEYYVHRIGRTGRAGKKGAAYTFVVGREYLMLKSIERHTKAKINKASPPTLKAVMKKQVMMKLDDVSADLDTSDLDQYMHYVEAYLEKINEARVDKTPLTTHELAAIMLKQALSDTLDQSADIEPVVSYEVYLEQQRQSGQSRQMRDGRSGARAGQGRRRYSPGDSRSAGRPYGKRSAKGKPYGQSAGRGSYNKANRDGGRSQDGRNANRGSSDGQAGRQQAV